MRSFSKLSSALTATTIATLLGIVALPGTALAGIEFSSSSSSSSGKVTAIQNEYGKDVLVKTDVEVSDLKAMQTTLDNQARQIEELKRSSGSSSSSSSKEIDDLKRIVNEQERDLDNLRKQVEELKRNSGSSSSSSNSEISNLKREVSDQDRTIDQLKRAVEDLSRKVK
jgi:chromosome segregation ATPase